MVLRLMLCHALNCVLLHILWVLELIFHMVGPYDYFVIIFTDTLEDAVLPRNITMHGHTIFFPFLVELWDKKNAQVNFDFLRFQWINILQLFKQGFWRGNVPALLMVMPYTAIQFPVLHLVKTLASGSSKTGFPQKFDYDLCFLHLVIFFCGIFSILNMILFNCLFCCLILRYIHRRLSVQI